MKNIALRYNVTLPVLLAAMALTFAVGCPWLTIPPTDGTVTGACCAADGTCTEVTEADCTTAGGTYQGDGTSCTPNPCAVAATGACCAADETCSEVTEAACTAAGGTYQGDGTSCTPNPCEAAPDGAALYAADCALCHGSDGTGPPDVTGKTAAELTTGLGSATHGAITLTADEIAAIATFLGG
jgi:hypothetical protein